MRTRVILTGSVENLGEPGDIVEVAAGYARNYLMPKNLAIPATAGNLRRAEPLKKRREAELAAKLEEARAVADKLAAASCSISVPVGADGKLFGSVTTAQIAEELKAQGFEIDRKKLVLEHPIREIGRFEVEVRLHPQLSVRVPVTVGGATATGSAPAAAPAETRPARRRPARKQPAKG